MSQCICTGCGKYCDNCDYNTEICEIHHDFNTDMCDKKRTIINEYKSLSSDKKLQKIVSELKRCRFLDGDIITFSDNQFFSVMMNDFNLLN